MFSKYNVKIQTLEDLGIEEVQETGKTFKENAILKVESIPSGSIGISDDSGLCIKALDNFPGIYSARFAKNSGGWLEAMEKLYKKIKNKGSQNAIFFCSLALKLKDGDLSFFEGQVEGEIVWPPRGKNGFGYDPFFKPKGADKTFGEMSHTKKIFMDHRFIAFKKLAKLHLTDN